MSKEITINTHSITGELCEYQPIEFIKVDRTENETIWDKVIREYHYLGYEKMIGQRIKYLVVHDNVLLAAISYNRASMRIGVRDKYIGWDEKQKREKLHQV